MAIKREVCKKMLETYYQPFEFKSCEYVKTKKKRPHGSKYLEYTMSTLLDYGNDIQKHPMEVKLRSM